MLSSLSWKLFFTAAISLAAAYYLFTSIVLYRREILNWLKPEQSIKEQDPKTTSSPLATQRVGIMGDISAQSEISTPRSTSISAEDFIVGNDEETEELVPVSETPVKDDLLIGTVADLLEEIKTVSQLIADTQTEKDETESLFRTLLPRYPNIAAGSFRDAVTLFISKELNEKTSLEISLGEIASWWHVASTKSK